MIEKIPINKSFKPSFHNRLLDDIENHIRKFKKFYKQRKINRKM